MALDRVVALNGTPTIDEQLSASAAITPGNLVEVDTGQWRRHANAGLNAAASFALERDELGNDFDVDYAASDLVKVGRFRPGDKVNALIASGQNLVIGEFVESAGDGTLRTLTTDSATDDTQRVSVVGQSAEASGAVVVLTRHAVWIV